MEEMDQGSSWWVQGLALHSLITHPWLSLAVLSAPSHSLPHPLPSTPPSLSTQVLYPQQLRLLIEVRDQCASW